MFFARIRPLEPRVMSLEEAVMNYNIDDDIIDMRPSVMPPEVWPVPILAGGLLFFMKRPGRRRSGTPKQ